MLGSWGEAGAPVDLLSKGSSFHLQFPLLIEWGLSVRSGCYNKTS